MIKINDKMACDSLAVYEAGTVAGNKDGHRHSDGNTKSEITSGGMNSMISDMVTCYQPLNVRSGDKLYLEANYDLDKHPV